MSQVTELRVCRFFKTQDGGINVAPAITVTFEGAVPDDIKTTIEKMIVAADGVPTAFQDGPLGIVRPMTKEEADEFLEDEKNEDNDTVTHRLWPNNDGDADDDDDDN